MAKKIRGYIQDEEGNIYVPEIPAGAGLYVAGQQVIKSTEAGLVSMNIVNNIEKTNTSYSAKRTDTDTQVWMGIGSGGTNHRSL